MANDATENHDEEAHEATYYKLSKHASIFHDPTQPSGDGKLLKGQVVKFEPTAAVLTGYRQHHILHASEKEYTTYQAKVKQEEKERAEKKAAANPALQVVAAPATATTAAAKTQAEKIIAEAEKKANKIIEDAEGEAERIKTEAGKPKDTPNA